MEIERGEYNMQEGAFALIDCLGFKGIWNRDNPQLIIDKLLKIEEIVTEQLNSTEDLYSAFEYAVLIDKSSMKPFVGFLSDTVVISLEYVENSEETEPKIQKAHLIDVLCIILTKVIDLFVEDQPHLTMRGCITYGKYLCEKNFIVGPAVDFAAEYMDIAEGAFVWLHKSAESVYEPFYLEQKSLAEGKEKAIAGYFFNHQVFQYEMPIKNAGFLECYVLNPLANFDSDEKRRNMFDIYKNAMQGNKIDIWLKQQNTLKLLNIGNEISKKYYEHSAKLKLLLDPTYQAVSSIISSKANLKAQK